MASSSALYSAVESIKVDAIDAFGYIENSDENNLDSSLVELERLAIKVPKAIEATRLMIEAAKVLEAE